MKLKLRTYQDTIEESNRTVDIIPDTYATYSRAFNSIRPKIEIVTINEIAVWTRIDDGCIFFLKYEVKK